MNNPDFHAIVLIKCKWWIRIWHLFLTHMTQGKIEGCVKKDPYEQSFALYIKRNMRILKPCLNVINKHGA
jgi:hypothetical protein